jgi:hypothetical protein
VPPPTQQAGFDVNPTCRIDTAIRLPFTRPTAVGGMTVRRHDNPDPAALFELITRAAESVGRGCGVGLLRDAVAQRMTFGLKEPPGIMASTAHDPQHGNRQQPAWLTAGSSHWRRAHGIPTPVNATIIQFAALKPYANDRPDRPSAHFTACGPSGPCAPHPCPRRPEPSRPAGAHA